MTKRESETDRISILSIIFVKQYVFLVLAQVGQHSIHNFSITEHALNAAASRPSDRV